MNIVITMGGLGSRFQKAGYTVPKYQIEVKGKTLFAWSMISMDAFKKETFIFLVRKEDNATSFIENECNRIGIPNYKIIELDRLTKGQAETASLAIPYCDKDKPIFIYNIDTYVEAGQMTDDIIIGDGFIPCFKAEGDHWSFVKLDSNGNAIEVREKTRISDYCTIGAYYFRTAQLYQEIYDKLYVKSEYLEHGEQYIAPMYNWMIQHEMNVRIQDIEPKYVHVLGTPEEVEVFKKLKI
ncbi:MAG: glycosyltransferase family 2 protein [Veillonella sp.]|nr:glycosyltransferase family 2 protein [Veillonella sp.]